MDKLSRKVNEDLKKALNGGSYPKAKTKATKIPSKKETPPPVPISTKKEIPPFPVPLSKKENGIDSLEIENAKLLNKKLKKEKSDEQGKVFGEQVKAFGWCALIIIVGMFYMCGYVDKKKEQDKIPFAQKQLTQKCKDFDKQKRDWLKTNHMIKDTAREDRKEFFKTALSGNRMDNFIGCVDTIHASEKSVGYVEIDLLDSTIQIEALLDGSENGSPIFQKMLTINKGDIVRFSCKMEVDEDDDDYFVETSLTESGSLCAPELKARLIDIYHDSPILKTHDQINQEEKLRDQEYVMVYFNEAKDEIEKHQSENRGYFSILNTVEHSVEKFKNEIEGYEMKWGEDFPTKLELPEIEKEPLPGDLPKRENLAER